MDYQKITEEIIRGYKASANDAEMMLGRFVTSGIKRNEIIRCAIDGKRLTEEEIDKIYNSIDRHREELVKYEKPEKPNKKAKTGNAGH